MANELGQPASTSGLDLRGIIRHHTDKSLRWNGSAFVADNTIADAAWATGAINYDEVETQDATAHPYYVGDWPAGITDPGTYEIEVRAGTDPAGRLWGTATYVISGAATSITTEATIIQAPG